LPYRVIPARQEGTMSGLGKQIADAMRSGTWYSDDGQFEGDDASELRLLITLCEEQIGRAERAIDGGNLPAARDLLVEAGRELAANVTAIWER
jgi:hypothetical protein